MTSHKRGSRSPSSANLVVYNLPSLGMGFMFDLVALYYMKYAIDELLIAPALVGFVFGASRIWDAVSDPLTGFLSDNTRSRLGRRRPWVLIGGISMALSFVLLWYPYTSNGAVPAWWLVVTVFGFYTSFTLINIPHVAWAAELSDDYHGKTRVFGSRYLVWTLGTLFAVGAMSWMTSGQDIQDRAVAMSWICAVVMVAMVLITVWRSQESIEHQGRGARAIIPAYRDVFKNPHARLLLIVYFIQHLGSAVVIVLTPFIAEYVIGAPELTGLFILLYVVPSAASVPLWVRMSRKLGKKELSLGAMVATSAGFLAALLLADGTVILFSSLAVLLGILSGCGSVVGPSLQADIIDWDEAMTAQRKEGSYFAAFEFAYKSASGITLFVTGVMLGVIGFIPNEPQSPNTTLGLVALFALFPAISYAAGSLLFSRFNLAPGTSLDPSAQSSAATPSTPSDLPAESPRHFSPAGDQIDKDTPA